MAYLPSEGAPGFPHVAALVIRAPGFGRVTLGATVRGGWPQYDVESDVPPAHELSSEDWVALCGRLKRAGVLPA